MNHFVRNGFTGQLQWTISNMTRILYQRNMLMVNGATLVRLLPGSWTGPMQPITLRSSDNSYGVDVFDIGHYFMASKNQPHYLEKYGVWYYLNDSMILDMTGKMNRKHRQKTDSVFESHMIEIDHGGVGTLSDTIRMAIEDLHQFK
jgi:hypothetical protein